MHNHAPVVGRDAELARLRHALAQAKAGRGGAVFLTGEPGIGKSRLAIEATGLATSAGMRVVRGRTSGIGPAVPFRPLSEALMSLPRGANPPPVDALGPYRPVLGRLVPDWGDPGDDGGDGSLVVLAEAVLRLLSVLGHGRGCLIVLEDLHDADVETLAVVEYVVDNLDELPAVLLATFRSGPCDAAELAQSALQRRTGTVHELTRLAFPQVRELIAACLATGVDEVPDGVAEHLWADSGGSPFMVEELLHGLVDNGQLVPSDLGWLVTGRIRTEVPTSLMRTVRDRTDRLDPQGRRMLSVAAVLGHRFPLSVVHRATGLSHAELLAHLHAGVAARLVVKDEPAPDWYAFQHPLTGEALLAQLTPTEQAGLSARAAAAVEAIHPGLPGEWCQLVAALHLRAGDNTRAAELFADAGRRALADGAAGSAVTLLEQAERLLSLLGDARSRADVVEALLYALAEAGEFERAFQLADTLDDLGNAGLPATRRAALHVRLAWVAHIAGRWSDGLAQVAIARALLGRDAADEDTAPLDAVDADLALEAPGMRRKQEAELLARRAVAAAERASLPTIACQAWLVIGAVARERDVAESTACYERVLDIATQHRLPMWRVHGLVRAAGNAWIAESDQEGLLRAGREAQRVGAIATEQIVNATIALHLVLCGDFTAAVGVIDECLAAAKRMQLELVGRHLLMSKATLAAHQGRRRDMEAALLDFKRLDGERSQEQPMALGMARAFCALLEENRALAREDLAAALASDDVDPTTFSLYGRHGVSLLLEVLAGDAGWERYEEVRATAQGAMRWNRQFVELAHAVLLGRCGRGTEAVSAVAAAQRSAQPYAMARHLGLRLVAEAAAEDGWGDPAGWLRAAEEYFHNAGAPAVASACRSLLRQLGVSVQQRRTGSERVPRRLRSLGVTLREFEVLELLIERLDTKTIGERLHISPRTVEKHASSLLAKTDTPDRHALAKRANALLSDP
ncbi:DNA-binding CsgD family transcriptional regulator [Actinokineospora baliensis]|uniref:helix-turn-helix transcriptional regulator n=1 Tax=Actinokineospora baliensis TaxID=547056 RepID=UPI00195A2461|nr:LuxR family transcriptional regulator [Actinokineospora baliensis]MBM7774786.1 DNA-binding CsgD family transcriptional regulator [Actinokineospora baliensis]